MRPGPGGGNDTPPRPRCAAIRATNQSTQQQLYGFTDKGAAEIMSTAEAFVADARSRSDISDEDKTLQARRHSQDTVDIVAGKNGTTSNGGERFVYGVVETRAGKAGKRK